MSRKQSYEDSISVVARANIRPMRLLMMVTQVNYPWRVPCMDLIPQGPAYVAGSLKAYGHQVRGVCTSYDVSGDPAPKVLERRIEAAVREHQPEAILLGGMAAEYLFMRDAIRYCRKAAPDVPIVCGGSIITNDPASFELLRPDFAVRDEGEVSTLELLHHVERGLSMEGVPGTICWKEGKPFHNPLRPAIENLDQVPYPDYEPLDIENYMALCNQFDNNWYVRTRTKPRLLPISSGRSCPYKCTFCQYSTVEGSRRVYRGRSMASVVQEVVHFYEKYHFNILTIYDDLFSVKADRILEFCQLMREAKLDLHWNASMRVGDVTVDLLREMKAAGCIHIGYGFESADDGVLRSMKKVITRAMIAKAIEASEAAGIGCQANFIYGDPAETVESVQATRAFYLEKCIQHIVHNDYVMPYPGSPIFDHCTRQGIISNRKTWYETIHLRPRYNMTTMSEPDFQEQIDPIINQKLLNTPFAREIRFTDAPRDRFQHPFFANRLLLHVHADCVYCHGKTEHIFPVPARDLSTVDGRYALLEPVRHYCHHCHHRMLYSMLPLVGLQEDFHAFNEALEGLVAERTPVVLTPMPGSGWMEILEAYGVPWRRLNARAFMTPGRPMDGVTFAGLPLGPFDATQAVRHAHMDVVVLPGPWENEVVRVLQRAGVPRVIAMRGAWQEADGQSRLDGWWVKRSNGTWYWADGPAEEAVSPQPRIYPHQPSVAPSKLLGAAL